MVASEFRDDLVDGLPSRHIEPARRLVKNDNSWLPQYCLCDNDFLLIAARQRSDGLISEASNDKLRDGATHEVACAALGNPSRRRNPWIIAKRQVLNGSGALQRLSSAPKRQDVDRRANYCRTSSKFTFFSRQLDAWSPRIEL